MNQTSTHMRNIGLCVGTVLAGVLLAGCNAAKNSVAGDAGTTTSAAPVVGAGSTVAAATGGSTGSGNESGGDGGSTACTTSDLSLKVVEGPQEGGSNPVGVYIVFTNTSKSTCTTAGYPGVDLYSGKTSLGEQSTREDSGTATEITLAPGGQATSYFTYPSGPVCDAAADTVQVIPPNQTTALRSGIEYVGDGGVSQPKSFNVCDGNLDVSPLQSGYIGPH